jgi:NAD(P)-dependent dehydrogenase (short-subunit alcohol dehydrogenase family)
MIQDNNDTSSINAKKNNNYSIINISSVHESVPQPDAAPYAASKGGMEMLTKNTAMECLCIHILVTALEKTLSSNLSARLHNYIINKKTQKGRALQADQKIIMNNPVMISPQ